jgi:hypothetical protein
LGNKGELGWQIAPTMKLLTRTEDKLHRREAQNYRRFIESGPWTTVHSLQPKA